MKFRAAVIKELECDELAYQVMECLEADMTPAEIAAFLNLSLADINNAKNIALVMKNGKIVDESKLPLAGGAQKKRSTAG